MKYFYAYKTSDGIRHEDSMHASSREEVFNALRKKGIKAIKVVAADGSKANGEIKGIRKRVVAIVAISLSLISAVFVYLYLTTFGQEHIRKEHQTDASQVIVNATALPRQEIQGDRLRIEKATGIFEYKADLFFAKFAEPGREVPLDTAERPTPDDIKKALAHPIRISDSEHTEFIDLKRIVVGIRKELQIYLLGGGTIEGFIEELFARQQSEHQIRKRALEKLAKLLNEKDSKSKIANAYSFWLSANAKLSSMGIYQIPIPEILREYQKNLDDEY